MTSALFVGALFGLGIYLLQRAVWPARLGLAASLVKIERARAASGPSYAIAIPAPTGGLKKLVGARSVAFVESRGWSFSTTKADLALADRSFEAFLATKVLFAVGGLLFALVLGGFAKLLGLPVGLGTPVWAGLLLAAVFFVLPDLSLRSEAADRRRDFRHVVGSFLDLVAMNLSGGRGVPEALISAASVGEGWAMLRLRETLTNARLAGFTQWEALGRLGEDLDIAELRDLSAALTLVADDGAKVKASLTARAATMRRREMADSEGKANERSQSMLVAQLLLCTGFLLFLTFPALIRVMGT